MNSVSVYTLFVERFPKNRTTHFCFAVQSRLGCFYSRRIYRHAPKTISEDDLILQPQNHIFRRENFSQARMEIFAMAVSDHHNLSMYDKSPSVGR